MSHRPTQRIKTITEYHRVRNLPAPEHSQISVIDYATMNRPQSISEVNWVLDFYHISIKRGMNAKMKYGQQECDFDEGVMFFISPNQTFRIEPNTSQEKQSGYMLLIHPDFIWNTSLAKTIKQYEFFHYSVNEALFLSEKEEKTLNGIMDNIQQECHANVDKFSKQIIISHIETLLNYSERFYNRQFISREKSNHQILARLEILLVDYFKNDNLISEGLPTVQYISEQLNLSQSYLSSLLKVLTGKSTQEHIHEKLMEVAKEKLSTTNLSISEIAYELGFEYPQSFNKFFKKNSNLTPLEFRQSFN